MHAVPGGQKVFLKSLLILFGLIIPIAIAQMLLYKAISQYELVLRIINPIIIYFFLFVVAFTLIKCQEKYLDQYFNALKINVVNLFHFRIAVVLMSPC